MKKHLLLFSKLFLLSAVLSTPAISQAVNTSDSLALVDFYKSTDGPGWLNHKGWLRGPVSTWVGISITGDRVTTIGINNNNLTGTLPSSIGNLTALVTFNIESNMVGGNIPPTIGNLTSLVTLDFNANHFSGSLPGSIGNLTNLQYLQVTADSISGSIPGSIGNLSSLIYLQLAADQLSGSLPTSIGNLSHLQTIIFDRNQLSGSLPSSIGNLTSLVTLSIGFNQFSGTLPPTIGKLTSAQYLGVEYNQFSGELPASLGNLTDVYDLLFYHNQFSGEIPSALGNLPHPDQLIFNHNNLSGSLPSSLGNLKTLGLFDFANNQLTGHIPASFAQLKHCSDIELDSNQLSGDIPPGVFNTDAIRFEELLNVRHNHLHLHYVAPGAHTFGMLYGDLSDNNCTFDGLEILAFNHVQIQYAPQANIHVNINGNTLSASAGGTLSNNTYKWFKVGSSSAVTITGDSTYTPTESGSYYAQVTNSIATDLTLQTDTVGLVIPGKANVVAVTVYPNPVTNVLAAQGLNDKIKSIITITDISGNVWIRKQVTGQKNYSIDVSKLKNGNYFLSISGGNTVYRLPFMKE